VTENKRGKLIDAYSASGIHPAAKMTLEEMDALAEAMAERGASGQEFEEKLFRRGWKPISRREGDGLEPCPSDCGVCHPETLPLERRMREARRKRR
jgi:hypothetical protein